MAFFKKLKGMKKCRTCKGSGFMKKSTARLLPGRIKQAPYHCTTCGGLGYRKKK